MLTRWFRWLEWTWDVQVSDNGSRTAAVIDGSRLLLTPLAHVVTPPPMASRTIVAPAAINSLSFCARYHGMLTTLPHSLSIRFYEVVEHACLTNVN
jgi:hypothetical protein